MRKRLNITLDEPIHKKLLKRATANYRSVSGEISAILNDVLTGVLIPADQKTISQPFISQPDPITNPPYKITLDTGYQPTGTISGATVTTTTPVDPDASPVHKDVPERWMRLHHIDPHDETYKTYLTVRGEYPDLTQDEFFTIQRRRQNVYKPDPTDPYDPTINNPFNKSDSYQEPRTVIG